MTRVAVVPVAVEDLDRLIVTHSLPGNARERVRRSLRPLERFPRMGGELGGRWRPLRFVLGRWRWLLIAYAYDEESDLVVVTMQDARSSSAATSA